MLSSELYAELSDQLHIFAPPPLGDRLVRLNGSAASDFTQSSTCRGHSWKWELVEVGSGNVYYTVVYLRSDSDLKCVGL